MRSFAIWLSTTLAMFGIVAGGYHWYLANNPRRILVVVDSSFPMRPDWLRVQSEIRKLSGRRYTRYAVISEKERVQPWSQDLDLRKLTQMAVYAPRNLNILTVQSEYPEFAEASEIHLLTNAREASAKSPNSWIVHVVGGPASDR